MLSRDHFVRLALCGLLVLFAWGLFTSYNEFPFFYHPDEPGKVEQVLTGNWNFHHPLLLLASTRAVLSETTTPQHAVLIGRSISALFAASAILCLALLAHGRAGILGALCVGLLLTLHHQLFELSHYFKEDTALLAGVGFAFLAMSLFWSRPSLARSALLGIACAVAISGKYIGAFMLLLAAPVWLVGSAKQAPSTRLLSLVLLLSALATGFIVINLPFLGLLGKFASSFERECEMVINGQAGMTRSIPHSQYWNVFHDNINPVLLAFLIAHVITFWKTRRQRSLPEWMTLLFPFVYAIALSFSPKSNDRYFLPATALFTYLAGMGVFDVARWLSNRYGFRAAITSAICGVLAISSQVPGVYRYWQAFQSDDRGDLRVWIETHLSSDAVLVIDPRCGLPSPEREDRRQEPLIQKVLRKKYASDFGTLDQLRAQGVTHVIVSRSDYGRFFLKSLRPRDTYQDQYDASRRFYERLFREGRLLWRRDRGTVIYLHPGIEVYAL